MYSTLLYRDDSDRVVFVEDSDGLGRIVVESMDHDAMGEPSWGQQCDNEHSRRVVMYAWRRFAAMVRDEAEKDKAEPSGLYRAGDGQFKLANPRYYPCPELKPEVYHVAPSEPAEPVPFKGCEDCVHDYIESAYHRCAIHAIGLHKWTDTKRAPHWTCDGSPDRETLKEDTIDCPGWAAKETE